MTETSRNTETKILTGRTGVASCIEETSCSSAKGGSKGVSPLLCRKQISTQHKKTVKFMIGNEDVNEVWHTV